MSIKTANVLARVEPEVKSKAESIMAQLGIPTSVVINMLYKQIIMTNSIPFSLSVTKPFQTKDTMSSDDFDNLMETGLKEAKAGNSSLANDVLADLKKEII